jgi:N-acetylmuramoyl-L-alanine amidase CwlD
LIYFLLLFCLIYSSYGGRAEAGTEASPTPSPPATEGPFPIKILVGGVELSIPSLNLKPDGVIMVPLSGPDGDRILELLGATLSPDQENKKFTLSLNGKSVQLTLGEGSVTIGDRKITLVTPPIRIEERLYVPLLSLPILAGYRLNLDDEKKTYYMDPLITSVDLTREGQQYRLRIASTAPFSYKTFLLRNPDRYVLDIPNAFMVAREQEIINEDVGKIRFAQFTLKPNVARVVIPLDVSLDVDILPRILTNQLTLAINVPSLKTPGQNFESQAIKGLSIEKGKDSTIIRLTATGPFQYEWHRLREPDNRFYIDFPKMELRTPENSFQINEEYLSEIQAAQFQRAPFLISRLVLHLEKPVACYLRTSENVPHQLIIEIRNELIEESRAFRTGMGVTSFPVVGMVVCLDPGHGGSDPGAINRSLGLQEKGINLDIIRRLSRILTRQGYNVVLTREDDRDVSYPGSSAAEELGARVRVANDMKADVFISIHCNASYNSAIRGTSCHWCKPEDRPLAADILSSLENSGASGKGVIRNKFYVLRHAKMPAVLVETAFLSNYDEARLLNSPEFREKVAQAIADGIRNYQARFKDSGYGSRRGK